MKPRPTEQFNRFPPSFCRLIARKANGHRPMSHTDIARAAGISRSYAIKISRLPAWDSLPLRTIEAFTLACGVNLLDTSDQIEFWRRRKKVYLEYATPAQRRMFAGIMSSLTAQGT